MDAAADMSPGAIELTLRSVADVIRMLHATNRPSRARSLRIRGVVGERAMRLVLPQPAVDALGLRYGDDVTGNYTDGRRATLRSVRDVEVTIGSRSGIFTAVVDPARRNALVGKIVLCELDLVVDSRTGGLAPRDPDRVTAALGW